MISYRQADYEDFLDSISNIEVIVDIKKDAMVDAGYGRYRQSYMASLSDSGEMSEELKNNLLHKFPATSYASLKFAKEGVVKTTKSFIDKLQRNNLKVKSEKWSRVRDTDIALRYRIMLSPSTLASYRQADYDDYVKRMTAKKKADSMSSPKANRYIGEGDSDVLVIHYLVADADATKLDSFYEIILQHDNLMSETIRLIAQEEFKYPRHVLERIVAHKNTPDDIKKELQKALDE